MSEFDDIQKKPSEIARKILGYFLSFLDIRPSVYEISEQVKEAKADLSVDIRESVLFLYEYLNLDSSIPLEKFLENTELISALDDYDNGNIAWGVVEAKWREYITRLEGLEKGLVHRQDRFHYKGFEIIAIQTPPVVLEHYREALDYVIDLFARRSVGIELSSLVECFVFRPFYKTDFYKSLRINGFYDADKKRVSIYWGKRSSISPYSKFTLKKRDITTLKYVMIHELAHGIYFHALSREARKFWVSAWTDRNLNLDPHDESVVLDSPDDVKDRLRSLGIPTDYGHTNPSEDFAETLTYFLVDSAALRGVAKKRLLGTLFHPTNSTRILRKTMKRRIGADVRIQHRIQETKYSCGAACVAAILNTEGVWVSEKEVRQAIGTNPEEGTPLPNIMDFFKRLGCEVDMSEQGISDLKDAISDGVYSIVSMQMWDRKTKRNWEETWSEGHYCIVKDLKDGHITLSDPSRRRLVRLPIKVFKKLWHDEDTDGTRYHNYVIRVEPQKEFKQKALKLFEKLNPWS